jgi:hypothetical protein
VNYLAIVSPTSLTLLGMAWRGDSAPIDIGSATTMRQRPWLPNSRFKLGSGARRIGSVGYFVA